MKILQLEFGAPTGLNQGIPSSGDGIGVMPVLVGAKPTKRKRNKKNNTEMREEKEIIEETETQINKKICNIKLPKLEKSFIEYVRERKNEYR